MSTDSASVREWTDILRRIRFGRSVQVSEKVAVSSEKVLSVARVLATYADSDGSRVYPSVARVAVDAHIDYTTAKRAMSVLRRYGLIRFVRHRGFVDEYQLAVPEDLMERVQVLSPAQYDLEVERMADRNRRSTGAPRTRTEPTERPADDRVQVPDAPVLPAPPKPSTGAGRPGTTGSTGAWRPAVQVRGAPATHQDLATSTTHHSRRDLRDELAVARARGPLQDPIPIPTELPRRRPGATLPRWVLAGAIRPDELPELPDDRRAVVLPFRRPRRSA